MLRTLELGRSPVVYREGDLSSTRRPIFAWGKTYLAADSERSLLG
jgi:hypothetical protein